MMVMDTVHSSGVGRMHAGQTRRMTIVRPPQSALQGSEAKRELLSSASARPSLVIRRRIMVPQLDEPDDARCHQLPPALPNPPKSLTDPSAARSHLHATLARSADEVREAAMTKAAPKTVHLFDLNELPTPLTDSFSPSESLTSTIASADSTTHVTAPPPTTDSSPSMINALLPDSEGDGAKLAVDLGVLLLEPAHHRPELPTPARKRLRKLSEYASAHNTVTDGGHQRDVAETNPETKVRGSPSVVDDEVLAAATVLMMLSSSRKRRRELSSIATAAGPSTSAAASETSSPTSLGSGGSVLLRPSNKQRYRSMADLMARTPILRRV